MFLVDTNVVSELRKGDRADSMVAGWISARDIGIFFISVITLMELEVGVLRKQRHDPSGAQSLRSWFTESVLPQFANRVLLIDSAVAMRCARLHVPNKCPDRDALIAATALVHGMTVVTRNTVDFERTGVPLINPWTG